MLNKPFHHIHIVGCSPRSGTTLMQEMMVACFDIDEHCEHEQSVFKAPREGAGILCTKHPREGMYMPCVLNHNPHVTAIYVVRDPRDVIVSTHKRHPDKYYSSLYFWLDAERHAQRLKNNTRFIVVRYEDLATDPDAVQRRLESLMPFLTRRFLFSEFHLHAKISDQSAVALNGVRPVDSSSIGRWRHHLDRVASQIQKHGDIADALIYYGYEKDRQWQNMLPIKPKHFESVMSEAYGMRERLRMAWRIHRKCFHYKWVSRR